jgi:hypothetical protein
LRNRIYELSFEDESVAIERNNKEPALLQVSKAIGTEATRLYYGSRRYFFLMSTSCVSDDPVEEISKAVCEARKLGRLVKLCGKSPFLSFEFLSMCDNCVCLEDLLGLLEVVRATGFEPDKEYIAGNGTRRQEKARSIESAKSMVHTHSREHQRASVAIARAIAMGRRARDREWSTLKLVKRFGEFLELVKVRPRKRRWPAYL